jgi:hypothetical protein
VKKIDLSVEIRKDKRLRKVVYVRRKGRNLPENVT